MSFTDKNHPAFPTDCYLHEDDEKPVGIIAGLTKREYFAALALQGLLAKETMDLRYAAQFAVQAADFLFNELNKPT